MLRLAAGFPDALARLTPHLGGALSLRLHDRPQGPGQALAVIGVLQDRVEYGAEDVVLALVEGTVANSHRAGSRVARQVLTERLGQVPSPVDPIHDLQAAVLGGLDGGRQMP